MVIVAASPGTRLVMVKLVRVVELAEGVVIWLGSGDRKVTSRVARSPTHRMMESHTLCPLITGGTLAVAMSVLKL